MTRGKLASLGQRAGYIFDTVAALLIVAVLYGGVLAWVALTAHALQPVLSPLITLTLVATVIIHASRAGWFTAMLLWVGVAAYAGSFVIAPAVSVHMAQSVCGAGLITAVIAGLRSITPRQERCLVAA